MEPRHVDALARALAGLQPRRRVLGTVVGLVAGLGATRAGGAACPAEQVLVGGRRCVCRTTGRPPGPEGCSCPQGQSRCGGGCVNTSIDPGNCGGCGQTCAGGACQGGSCGCTPVDCASAGCGLHGDGCGNTVDCGICERFFGVAAGVQVWEVPPGTSSAQVTLCGGAGAPGEASRSQFPADAPFVDGGAGGQGSLVTATLAVATGQVYQVLVGGQGSGANGGANGGGNGGVTGEGITVGNGGGGGGVSVIRLGENELRLAAGGGGGGGGSGFGNPGQNGGAGGSPGQDGASVPTPNSRPSGGGGGRSDGGGAGGLSSSPPVGNGGAGGFGPGGSAGGSFYSGGGGGGGGYYGGGAGGASFGDSVPPSGSGGGGGGNSFASGVDMSNVSISTGGCTGDGFVTIVYTAGS